MSITVPCLWMSSLSSPITSHLPGITNRPSPAAWNSEQISSRSSALPSRLSLLSWEKQGEVSTGNPVGMQTIKAEDAFSTAKPVAMASHARAPGRRNPPRTTEPHTVGNQSDNSLSRIKLEKLNHSEPTLSAFRAAVDSSSPRESTRESLKEEQAEMHRCREWKEETRTLSKEGAVSAGGDEKKLSSDLQAVDKRKMKRFRLTHSQTRFLMGEFTRQAHPDAAYRERLSREIPGLTPRQVQVWFQNRRAKLKRLTSGDRERMLRSRALPDGFDTTQVLRTPFDHKAGSETPVASPRGYIATDSDGSSLKMILTDGPQRPNEDDYVISPLSSTSTCGNHFSSATPGRHSDGYATGTLSSRSPLVPTMNSRAAFPAARSSSFSGVGTQAPSFAHGLHLPSRFSRTTTESLNHPYLNYGATRSPNGIPQVPGYQRRLTMPVTHMNSQLPPHSRHMAMHSVPVSDSQDYRTFTYDNSYALNTPYFYAHANASTMSLPASFSASDTANAPQSNAGGSADDRLHNQHLMDPLRNKYSFDYANYI